MLKKILYKIKINIIHRKNKIKTKNDSRTRKFLLSAILIFSWFLSQAIQISAENANTKDIQKGIAADIIRFHVIANSDSDEDQQLKYQVKDALVKSLSPFLMDARDKKEAEMILMDKMPLIKSVAQKTIEDKGFNYPISVSLTTSYFPMKVYGDYVFPPGTYEALKVEIGEAEGKNWWCVMFPALCFVDETYTIVDQDTEENLKFLLTEEEFEALKSKDTPIKVKFKLFEIIKKLFK